MKSKLNIKLLFFLLAIIFLILTIISIQATYARYVTSLTAKSTVELGKWLILVNEQNILNNSDISNWVFPDFSDSTYITEGKIAPTSTGTVQIVIDHSNVTVPFVYELTFSHDDATVLNDFQMTSYSINGESTEASGNSTIITDTIAPDEENKTQTLILNFAWLDNFENEEFNDVEDTYFAENIDELGLRFNIKFTQLQPTT